MNKDLYFIPIITKALQQKDSKQALKRAFEQIKSLGQSPEHQQGYRQFERFMDSVDSHMKKGKAETLNVNVARVLMTDLTTDTFDGSDEEKQTLLDIIQSRPNWQKEYQLLKTEVEQLSHVPDDMVVSILRDNEAFRRITFSDIPDTKTIDNITSGSYSISLESGRVIWEGKLAEQDILWAKAYPKEPFRLAADTAGQKAKPTKQVSLFNDEITIMVFAGLESGRMEIEMNRSKGSK